MEPIRTKTVIIPIQAGLLSNPNRNNPNEHKNVQKAIYIFIKAAHTQLFRIMSGGLVLTSVKLRFIDFQALNQSLKFLT